MTTYRAATLSELSLILDWAAKEGWNPGLNDAAAFFAADPEGFFVAVEQGKPVASISVVNHTSDFAFLGLYIVQREFRGRGIGFELWKHALRHAGARTVGLDGVEAQQETYRASGFTHAGGTTRFTGRPNPQHRPDIEVVDQCEIESLIEIEAIASGVSKHRYLHPWISGDADRTTFVKRDQDVVTGFCTIRTCTSGAKIGPLIADNADIAQQLLAHAATGTVGPISMDVPDTSTVLTDLCQTSGWQPGFKTARMYKGEFDTPGHGCYAVSSMELG